MKRRLAVAIALLCLPLMLDTRPAAAAGSLQSLLRKADMVMRSKTAAAVFEMKIKTRRYQRTMKIVFWDDQRDGSNRSLIKLLGPALWRGYGTLKLGSQLKLYNPRNDHVTVVGQSMLGDSWMGSHFSNDDLVKETRLAEHYVAKLAKRWKAPAPLGGEATYRRIALRPKPTAPVAWGRIDYELWERGGVVMPVKAAYFRKAGDSEPRRTMHFGDVKRLGGRIVPATMKVTVRKKPGEYTLIRYLKVKFDVRIPAAKFTEQALRR